MSDFDLIVELADDVQGTLALLDHMISAYPDKNEVMEELSEASLFSEWFKYHKWYANLLYKKQLKAKTRV